jgi:hypothetical protein
MVLAAVLMIATFLYIAGRGMNAARGRVEPPPLFRIGLEMNATVGAVRQAAGRWAAASRQDLPLGFRLPPTRLPSNAAAARGAFGGDGR